MSEFWYLMTFIVLVAGNIFNCRTLTKRIKSLLVELDEANTVESRKAQENHKLKNVIGQLIVDNYVQVNKIERNLSAETIEECIRIYTYFEEETKLESPPSSLLEWVAIRRNVK